MRGIFWFVGFKYLVGGDFLRSFNEVWEGGERVGGCLLVILIMLIRGWFCGCLGMNWEEGIWNFNCCDFFFRELLYCNLKIICI